MADNPELTRSQEVVAQVELLEGDLQDDRKLWLRYVDECNRTYSRHVYAAGGPTEEMRATFNKLLEKRGQLVWGEEPEPVSLADRLDIAGILLDLSKQGISLPEIIHEERRTTHE